METLQNDIAGLRPARLSSVTDSVDHIIGLLTEARGQIAETLDSHTTSTTMWKLEKAVKDACGTANNNLKDVTKGHKNLAKVLDKPLPSDHDPMAEYPSLINRAIAMHLLREGQFAVASKFIAEASDNPPTLPLISSTGSTAHATTGDMDEIMAEGDLSSSLQSQELQTKFAEMYTILQELKQHNLMPAIVWARQNSEELEARGSNLEFELSKLQYVWIFKGPAANGLPDDDNNGPRGALAWACRHFSRFRARHLREMQELASAMAYASNLAASPYSALFATDTAFGHVAASFTRDFCSLLGLAAESPLHVAAAAGALALPLRIKFESMRAQRGTEWTSADELAFETPLPARMLYHSIFVCPVSKEQTTDANPPMIIPCGHVLARETLQKLCKGQRFKCPYCPSEGHLKDARQIIL